MSKTLETESTRNNTYRICCPSKFVRIEGLCLVRNYNSALEASWAIKTNVFSALRNNKYLAKIYTLRRVSFRGLHFGLKVALICHAALFKYRVHNINWVPIGQMGAYIFSQSP